MRISVTILKHGLALEAELSKITRQVQKTKDMGYNMACREAERLIDPVAYTQITHSDSMELDLQTLGEHIAKGAPFKIQRLSD